jgi:hypothetical protein
MVIALVAAAMVQVPVHKVVDMVAVRYRVMTALRSVHVRFFMAAAVMCGSARGRVRRADGDSMFLHAPTAGVVQMTVVQVVGVAFVLDSRMAAVRAMLVRMGIVCFMSHD